MTNDSPETKATTRRPVWLPVAAAGLVVAVAVAGALVFTRGGTDDGVVAVGGEGTVDGIVFDAFEGEGTVDLADFSGRPVVVNYWASWCLPCIEEMPDFQTVYEDVGDRVEFLGVNVLDGTEEAQRLIEITGVRYPLARDREGDRFRDLEGRGMPTTFFVDEEGVILERFTGQLDGRALRERINRHFGI